MVAATRMPPDGPAFDLVLLAHVACAVVGLAALVAAALSARRLGRLGADDEVPDSLRRYYSPGPNLAGRALFGVPVFGFALLALSGHAFSLHQAWVLAGLGLWAGAAGVAEMAVWPAERRLRQTVAGAPAADGAARRRRCATVVGGAAAAGALVVCAGVLMVLQP